MLSFYFVLLIFCEFYIWTNMLTVFFAYKNHAIFFFIHFFVSMFFSIFFCLSFTCYLSVRVQQNINCIIYIKTYAIIVCSSIILFSCIFFSLNLLMLINFICSLSYAIIFIHDFSSLYLYTVPIMYHFTFLLN